MITRASLAGEPGEHALPLPATRPDADTGRRRWPRRARDGQAVRRAIVDASIGLLFVKGLLLVPVTIFTFATAYRAGQPTPIAGVVSCAAGTFALAMACVAAWVRKQLA